MKPDIQFGMYRNGNQCDFLIDDISFLLIVYSKFLNVNIGTSIFLYRLITNNSVCHLWSLTHDVHHRKKNMCDVDNFDHIHIIILSQAICI